VPGWITQHRSGAEESNLKPMTCSMKTNYAVFILEFLLWRRIRNVRGEAVTTENV